MRKLQSYEMDINNDDVRVKIGPQVVTIMIKLVNYLILWLLDKQLMVCSKHVT